MYCAQGIEQLKGLLPSSLPCFKEIHVAKFAVAKDWLTIRA